MLFFRKLSENLYESKIIAYLCSKEKSKNMKIIQRLWSPVLLLAALVATAYFLLTYESEYLWKLQELNLFLDTPLFLKQQMVTSGWLLTWLGTYFTEFFYHPWIGVLLLCLWWALLMLVTARAFRIPMKWGVLLLIPVAALLVSDVDLGYWIYYLKLRGHFFAGTIGTTLAVASVWLYRLLPSKYYLRPAYMVVSTAVLYPLIGFYGLLATLLMVVLTWRLEGMALSARVVATVVGLLSMAFWPLFYYNYVFCQTNLQNIWWTGLPLFVMDEEYPVYYAPYYILGLSLVLMAAFYRYQAPALLKRPVMWAGCQVVLVAAVVWCVQHYWYRDFNFHKELRMLQCVEQLDWQGVLNEAAYTEDEPTRAIVMMKNLALFRLGRQGDEMYHYKTGAKASTASIPVSMTQVFGRPVYYHYGLLNYCYRWCLEDGVEFGWRAEYLKYLTRCALVNGEYRVARKYIDQLKHTRYHREWTAHYEKFLDNDKAVQADAEFQPILRLMKCPDMLGSDNGLAEKFLMTQFVTVGSDDKLYQEQALIAALWMKDIQTFWPRFFQYAQSHTGEHMPIHFQEAAYLYGNLEHQVDISHMPFDQEVIKTYNDFMAFAQQCQGMSEEQMKTAFYPRFGHTFYYEYFLIRNQKLY